MKFLSRISHQLSGFIFIEQRRLFDDSMRNATRIFVMIILLLLSVRALPQTGRQPDKPFDEKVRQTLKNNAATLRFIENKGQIADKNILFYFEGKNGSAYIERNKIRFIANDDTVISERQENGILKNKRYSKGTHTFTLTMRDANNNPQFVLGNAFRTKYNFFFGGIDNAVSGVQAAKDLTIKEIYPGVDLRLYSSSDGGFEFDWILAPGADFHHIKLHFDGQDQLTIDPAGNLLVKLRFTTVKFNIPESYQVSDSGKMPVHFAFHKSGKNAVAFTSHSKIDNRYALVIDPILNWGTLMDDNDSNFDEYLFSIQVDSTTGIVYCAGTTNRQITTTATPYDANGYLNTISGLTGGTGASSLPNVAVVYRIDSAGNDLLDLTLYGPATVASSNDVTAYALSLSPSYVFIGGTTNVGIPTAGTPFDNSRSSTDGYVAVFTRDLGTLVYATYLGGTGTESRGVTSVRAISDNSFVVGLTAAAALPAAYISTGAAQTTFGGASDFYIAKFTSLNTLSWGTYVGGTGTETFNDLEVLSDGRVAFCGYSNGTFTLTNSIAKSGTNEDGVIGVLNSTGTGYNYLDRIGGSGNDRFYDVEIVGESIYFSGSGASGFPTSSDAYDQTYNGGNSDAVIGTVSTTGGSSTYKATYYGTSGTDFGDGIRLVTKIGCPTYETLILAFGTVAASGLPTINVKDEPFYNANFTAGGNSGLDMFFSGFSTDLTTLKYGTYMGGNQDDYLGATGDPRGANQLWVNGTNAYVGTTTHSSSHNPTILSGGFDDVKSNGVNDAHIIFSIAFGGIFDTASIAPLSASSDKAFVCPGDPAVLTVSGGSLGTSASWMWYTESCGGTYLDSGASVTVYPVVATTYYVRAEGACNTTTCTDVTVPVACVLDNQHITLNGTIAQKIATLHATINYAQKVSYFELQRSTDGSSFSIVKVINVNDYANSNGYWITDNVASINGDYVYYRLKVVNENGGAIYGKTLNLALSGNDFNAVIVPNPVHDNAKLDFYSTATSVVHIRLFNAQGKLLKDITVNGISGFNRYELDNLGSLPPGIYFIGIRDALRESHLKLVKQ